MIRKLIFSCLTFCFEKALINGRLDAKKGLEKLN